MKCGKMRRTEATCIRANEWYLEDLELKHALIQVLVARRQKQLSRLGMQRTAMLYRRYAHKLKLSPNCEGPFIALACA